jgi:hypothetical protein
MSVTMIKQKDERDEGIWISYNPTHKMVFCLNKNKGSISCVKDFLGWVGLCSGSKPMLGRDN